MALNGTFLVKILDIYSALSMKDCIIGTTLLLFYLSQSQNINKWLNINVKNSRNIPNNRFAE